MAASHKHSLRVQVDGLGIAQIGEVAFSGKPYHILAFDVRSDGAASKPDAEKI